MRGQYYPTTVTLSSNQVSMPGLDVNANLKTNIATLISGEDQTNDRLKVYQPFSYSNITTNTTAVAKSGAGFLHTITLNNPGKFTVADLVITVYDNTAASGTKIGTWTIPVVATAQVVPPITIDVAFTTGLTILTSGPTVAADITVSYF